MRLTRKHIGKFFDVQGGDGSWYYQLVAIRSESCLFLAHPSGQFEIEGLYDDYRPVPKPIHVSKRQIAKAWKTARRTP